VILHKVEVGSNMGLPKASDMLSFLTENVGFDMGNSVELCEKNHFEQFKVKAKVKEGKRELSVPDKHQKRICIQTLKMPDAMVGVAGGPSKEEARKALKDKFGYTDEQIKKLEESVEKGDKKEVGKRVVCPKCGKKVWDKVTVDQRLNKCWSCGTRFDNDEDEVAESTEKGMVFEFKKGDKVWVRYSGNKEKIYDGQVVSQTGDEVEVYRDYPRGGNLGGSVDDFSVEDVILDTDPKRFDWIKGSKETRESKVFEFKKGDKVKSTKMEKLGYIQSVEDSGNISVEWDKPKQTLVIPVDKLGEYGLIKVDDKLLVNPPNKQAKEDKVKESVVKEGYGDRRDYPKIEIFVKDKDGVFQYKSTTTWAKTAKEAKEQYLEKHKNVDPKDVKASFASKNESVVAVMNLKEMRLVSDDKLVQPIRFTLDEANKYIQEKLGGEGEVIKEYFDDDMPEPSDEELGQVEDEGLDEIEPDIENDVFYTPGRSDHAGFFYQGKRIAVTHEDLKGWMKQSHLYPAVWSIYGDGNISPYTLDESKLSEADQQDVRKLDQSLAGIRGSLERALQSAKDAAGKANVMGVTEVEKSLKSNFIPNLEQQIAFIDGASSAHTGDKYGVNDVDVSQDFGEEVVPKEEGASPVIEPVAGEESIPNGEKEQEEEKVEVKPEIKPEVK
jgi:hypothetical protein